MKTYAFPFRLLLFGILLTWLSLGAVPLTETQTPTTSRMLPVRTSYTQVFRDDFSGATLNPDVWQAYLNGGTISVDSGWVTLSRSGASDRFPYVHTKYNPIPPNGNFAVKVGFEYLTVTAHGDGFSVDDRLPANGSPGSWAWQPTIYTLWQDSVLGFVLFDHSGTTRYHTSAPHLNYHDIEFRWLDNSDEYYIDGQLINTVTRDSNVPRPVDLWFGNPVIPPGSTEWTSFKIDYIEVDSIGGPVPFFDLPIDYPGRGNATEQEFISAWQSCTTAFFDHHYPLVYNDNILVPFWGITTTVPAKCTLFENCYSGHEGYDFDDLPRCGGTPAYPVANGMIVNAFCDRSPNPPYSYKGYGCQVRIRHDGANYETLYGHLRQDAWFTSTIELSGTVVTTNQRIGTIGCTGNCDGSHLHLNVYYQGGLVDPSGWDGNYADPYVTDRNGPTSYRLWLYSPRRSTPVNDTLGTNLTSPSGNTTILVPPNAYGEDFEITITELAPMFLPDQLASAGRGFVLEARNLRGEAIPSLNQNVAIEVRFDTDDIVGIQADTLSLYAWNATLDMWTPLTTTVSLPSTKSEAITQVQGTATTVVQDTGYIALLGNPYIVYLPFVSR